MTTCLANNNLGLSPTSLAVLAILSSMSPDGLVGYDDKSMKYPLEVKTAAWYNGRENGIVLSYSHSNHTWGKWLHVVICEHRNTDRLTLYHWVAPRNVNPPTIQSNGWTDEVYRNGQSFDEYNLAPVIEKIRDLINSHIIQQMEIEPVLES